jgi:hypothetical protein
MILPASLVSGQRSGHICAGQQREVAAEVNLFIPCNVPHCKAEVTHCLYRVITFAGLMVLAAGCRGLVGMPPLAALAHVGAERGGGGGVARQGWLLAPHWGTAVLVAYRTMSDIT